MNILTIITIVIVVNVAKDDCAKNNRPCPENSVCVRKGVGRKSECECIKGYEYNWRTKFCEGIRLSFEIETDICYKMCSGFYHDFPVK